MAATVPSVLKKHGYKQVPKQWPFKWEHPSGHVVTHGSPMQGSNNALWTHKHPNGEHSNGARPKGLDLHLSKVHGEPTMQYSEPLNQQFSAFDVSHPNVSLLNKTGFKMSNKQVGTGKADTQRSFVHPQHGLVTHFSNGSWEHHNNGSLIREGQGHSDLTKHLGSLTSQHTEPINTQFTEQEKEWLGLDSVERVMPVQMGEDSLHETLKKHGYKVGMTKNTYKHPDGHKIGYFPESNHRWDYYGPNNTKATDFGKVSLEAHLKKVHST